MDLNHCHYYTLIDPVVTYKKILTNTVKIIIEGSHSNKKYVQIMMIPNNPYIYQSTSKLINFIRNHKEYIVKQIPLLQTLTNNDMIQPLTISRNLTTSF